MCAGCQTICLFLSLTPPILNLRDEGRLKASESPSKIRSVGVFVKHGIDWDKLRTPILMNLSAREPIFFGTWLLPAPPEIHLCPRWIVQTARASTWEVKWWNRVPNSPHFMQHVRITKFKLRYQWTVKSICIWYLGKGSPQCQKLEKIDTVCT